VIKENGKMDHQSIVWNEEMMSTFINKLKGKGVIIIIMMRRKYNKNDNKDAGILHHRYYKNNDKQIIFALKTKQFMMNNELLSDLHSVVAMCTINKLDEEIASKKSALHIMSQMVNNQPISRIDKIFLSELQKSSAYDYLHLDIDIDPDFLTNKTSILLEIKDKLSNYLSKNDMIIETKNGYHILINVIENKQLINTFYKEIPTINGASISITNKGAPVPIPGTLQAGFKVLLL
jgi:hypothetical protein